jgi:hypothetical protein
VIIKGISSFNAISIQLLIAKEKNEKMRMKTRSNQRGQPILVLQASSTEATKKGAIIK